MTIVDEYSTDIKLDEKGQPVVDESGDFSLVTGDECWKQDLKLETEKMKKRKKDMVLDYQILFMRKMMNLPKQK